MAKSYRILAKKAMVTGLITLFLAVPFGVSARTPSDPRYIDQQPVWDAINAPAAWDVATGSREVIVAVIDTGVDISNEDLRSNIWHNKAEIPANGIDDDKNGYTDDVDGWNFVEGNNDVRPSVFESKDDKEAVRHGTLVAGLIGAVGENGVAGVGMNWQVNIMALRAISNSGSGSSSDVVNAVNYAIRQGADVISMSFVGDFQGAQLRDSFYRAYENGIVVVAASGNNRHSKKGDLDEFPQFPVCFDKKEQTNWLIGVTSINARNQLSSFADYGSCVDISAPGEGVYSTDRYAPQYGYPKSFNGPFQGTSFAAPLVAGAAALIKSIRPDLGPSEIINILLTTTDSIDSFNPGFEGKIGVGRLNVGAAIMKASPSQNDTATTSAAAPITDLFYRSKADLRNLNFITGESKTILGFNKNELLLDGSAAYFESAGDRAIPLLIKRDQNYYFRVVSKDGSLISESPLLAAEIKNKTINTVKRLQPIFFPDGTYKIVVEAKAGDRQQTPLLLLLSQQLQIEQQFKFSAGITGWDVARHDNAIVVAERKTTTLTLTKISLETAEKKTWSLKGVTRFYDVRSAATTVPGHDEIGLLVERSGRIQWYILDIDTNSFRNGSIADKSTGQWRLIMTDLDQNGQSELLPLELGGGSFSAFTPTEKIIKTIRMPAISTPVF